MNTLNIIPGQLSLAQLRDVYQPPVNITLDDSAAGGRIDLLLENNARIEGIAERPTYRSAWAQGQRCLILADWYQEPNWETGKNIWWRLMRADGAPWALAGIWSEWVDPATGEHLHGTLARVGGERGSQGGGYSNLTHVKGPLRSRPIGRGAP